MGALEKIDWGKLDGELYSVIAHASAGTNFCSPDLQMAVDGCIEEMKRALNAYVCDCQAKKLHSCPTCGAACTVGGEDKEGTHYYVPV